MTDVTKAVSMHNVEEGNSKIKVARKGNNHQERHTHERKVGSFIAREFTSHLVNQGVQ